MICTMVYLMLYNMVYVGRKDSSRHSMLPTLASSQNQSDCCRSMWRSTSPELLSWKIWSSKCCITQTLTRRTWIMTCTTVWWGVSKTKTFRSSIYHGIYHVIYFLTLLVQDCVCLVAPRPPYNDKPVEPRRTKCPMLYTMWYTMLYIMIYSLNMVYTIHGMVYITCISCISHGI